MKRRMIYALTFALFASMLIIPVSAKNGVDYLANGKLVEYGVPGGGGDAEVVNGRWSVKVKGDDVDFKAFYRERNLDAEAERSPVGSIDHFWNTSLNLIL